MPTHFRTILALTLAAALSACASLDRAFANRVACTADGQRMVVASMYGPIGVASFVAAPDAQALCHGRTAPQPQAKPAAP